MFRILASLALLAALQAGPLPAQAAADALPVGQHVRVHQGKDASYTGVLLSAGPDTMTVAIAEQGPVVFLRSTITGIDVQNGTRSNAGRGAVKGLVVGGGIGLMIGIISAASQDDSGWFYTPPGQLILGGTLGGAMFGGALGALIGTASRSPRWVPIVTPTAPAQPDGAAGKGVALGMNFAF